MYVIDKIIEKTERSSVDWRRDAAGTREFPLKEYHKKDYGTVPISELARELRGLEEEGLLNCRWYQKYSEPEWCRYRLEDLSEFYRRAGRREKYLRLELLAQYLHWFGQGIKKDWLRRLVGDLEEQLEEGKIPSELKAAESYLQSMGNPVGNWPESAESCGQMGLFAVLGEIDRLETPVYKRVFSSRCLKDQASHGKTVKSSKAFEQIYQGAVISLAKQYHPDVDDNMDATQVLSQLGIEEYAQVLALKGPARLLLGGREIDLAPFVCGAVLNSQTLTQGTPVKDLRIQRVITVENQANYEAMPYEPGTLIIFCHGYFTPRERTFLKKLRACLEGQPVEYLHTGDLDYGGVCIFQYNRRMIFPELQPFLMDAEQFERYREYAEPLEPETLEKLRRVREPLLQPLIGRMLETGMGVEQEKFL